jgi:hypothetical protein
MLYVHVTRSFGKLVSAHVATENEKRALVHADVIENRNYWKTMGAAEEVARVLNESAGEQRCIATDAGPLVSPRYDVIELPRVGDKVSYAFNGDYYPCGEITKISKTLKQITAEDKEGKVWKFYRVRQTGCWRMDGTWSLVPGHISRLNPEF